MKFQSFEHVHPFIHDWVKKIKLKIRMLFITFDQIMALIEHDQIFTNFSYVQQEPIILYTIYHCIAWICMVQKRQIY
jgi:hypothetical protein